MSNGSTTFYNVDIPSDGNPALTLNILPHIKQRGFDPSLSCTWFKGLRGQGSECVMEIVSLKRPCICVCYPLYVWPGEMQGLTDGQAAGVIIGILLGSAAMALIIIFIVQLAQGKSLKQILGVKEKQAESPVQNIDTIRPVTIVLGPDDSEA